MQIANSALLLSHSRALRNEERLPRYLVAKQKIMAALIINEKDEMAPRMEGETILPHLPRSSPITEQFSNCSPSRENPTDLTSRLPASYAAPTVSLLPWLTAIEIEFDTSGTLIAISSLLR